MQVPLADFNVDFYVVVRWNARRCVMRTPLVERAKYPQRVAQNENLRVFRVFVTEELLAGKWPLAHVPCIGGVFVVIANEFFFVHYLLHVGNVADNVF